MEVDETLMDCCENNVNFDVVQEEKVSDIVREIREREILHWNYRGLNRLPQELIKYGSHIQELYLKENQMEELPEKLHKDLPFLTNLYLTRNCLTSVPGDLHRLTCLTVLDLSRNKLTEFPSCLVHLPNLQTLDLSNNMIKHLPHNIGNLNNLEYFVCISNLLEGLPGDISRCQNLIGLYLSRNKIKSVPEQLIKCKELRELYLDYNELVTIPESFVRFCKLNIISLSGNKLLYLPHIPFISCPRMLIENNDYLTYIPYSVGCQQSVLTYSNQASWCAMSQPVVENTLNGIWSLRVQECGNESLAELPSNCISIRLSLSGKVLVMPRQLKRVYQNNNFAIPSLFELSLRNVYTRVWKEKMELSLKTPSNIQTHFSQLMCPIENNDTRLNQEELEQLLPKEVLLLLSRGPVAYCSNPACSSPIFHEAAVEIIPKDVQRRSWDEDEPELYKVYASRFYCSAYCRQTYFNNTSLQWEKQLLNSALNFHILNVS